MTGVRVVFILAALSPFCFAAIVLIGAVRHMRSRGEEAGTPEERDDQMAVWTYPSDHRAVAAVFGEYAREMPELRQYADEVEGLYLIEVDR